MCQTTGKKGEQLVCDMLQKQGMKIVARNIREKFAEIDIVAQDGETICFVEVRSRNNTTLGHPLETITAKKQRNIRRLAELYLAKHKLMNIPVRFDVATIVWSSQEFVYLPNAF